MHCWQVFEEIKKNENLKVQFLGAGSQRSLFVQIMDRASDSQFAADNYCLNSQVHYVGILTFVGILWRVSKLYIFGKLIV